MATVATAKAKYKLKIKAAKEQNLYAEGMASFWGVDTSTIAESAPVKNWKKAFETDDKIDAKADAWEAGLRTAFGLPVPKK